MVIHIPTDLEESVRAAVLAGRYASEDALVAEVLRAHLGSQPLEQEREVPVEPELPPRKPLWERVAELRKTIPEEEWAKLPVDGAAQLDHYIYGSPKRLDP